MEASLAEAMAEEDNFHDGVTTGVGAATALQDMVEADIQLFVYSCNVGPAVKEFFIFSKTRLNGSVMIL